MTTTANPDRDPDDPLPSTTNEEMFTPSQQFYETLVEELATHARQWLGTSSSQSGLFFTVEELDTLSIKIRPDGIHESDILKLVQTKTEKTKTIELNQLYYIQSKLIYQIRIAQEFAVEYFDRSPTQLDIHTFKQQELESVKELIELELRRRTTYTETDTDTTTTTKNTIDLLNVDGESSTLDDSTPSTLGGTTSAMNTMNTSSTPSTSSNSNKLKKTNVIHETMVLLPLTQSTVQLLINFFESVQRTFTIESIRSINTGSNMPTEDQLEKRKDFNMSCSAINPSPSYNIVERWNGKLIQIRLNKLKYYRFGR